MNLRRLFKPAAVKGKVPEEQLPALHSFVDVAVGMRPSRSVAVEEVDANGIVVRDLQGRIGERGVFVYNNPLGRFRFASTIANVDGEMTTFAIPARIEAIGGAAQKRSTVRMDTLVAGEWRIAPGGKGVGEFIKGSIRDISRGGCALIINRQNKNGALLEVKMVLKNDAPPLTLLGEVMRSEQIPTSGKFSHGLRFRGMTPQEDQAILEFIHRRQAELRSRGLA